NRGPMIHPLPIHFPLSRAVGGDGRGGQGVRGPAVRPSLRLFLFFFFLCLLPHPAAALPQVTILRPAADQPLFGETEVLVDARPGGSPVQRVELSFDSLHVGSVEAPPYRFVVDAGQENKEHRIEAVARDAAGGTASASLTTPVLRVDMQIDASLQ